jgi:CRISPR-associated protein (TIGR03986 family)
MVVRSAGDANYLPDHHTYTHETYRNTGYFDVNLITRSPLYVRASFTRREFDLDQEGKDRNGHRVGDSHPFADLIKNKPDFFHTGVAHEPVIPGSSLRGMLRNLVEIVGYGKVRWVTEKRPFFRTVDTSAVGDAYRQRMVEDIGAVSVSPNPNATGYRAKVKAGWIRKRSNGPWYIEECGLARLEVNDLKSGLGLTYTSDLYSERGRPVSSPTNLVGNPNFTPNWRYQHMDIWVDVAPQTDHFYPQKFHQERPIHPNLYLRYARATNPSATNNTGAKIKGMLVLSGPMQNKHMEFVFIRKLSPQTYEVPNGPAEDDINRRLIDLFHDNDQITRWQRLAFLKDKPSANAREADGHLQMAGEPVFFLLEKDRNGNDQLTFFGRAQMFRLPYQNRPVDLVPEQLRRPEDVDYADAMFGFVRTRAELEDMKRRGLPEPRQGAKGRSYAGRVFITNARMTEAPHNDTWLSPDPFPPQILATPKPTAFQHYLVQPQGSTNSRQLRHFDSQPPNATVIRGHKRYWLQGSRAKQDLEASPAPPNASTQHTMFKPLKDGVKFRFRIYFENLSDRELGALSWVLHPLGDQTRDYCHQLGMGKSLGMGAVKLDATLHLTDRAKRYSILLDDQGTWESGETQAPVQLGNRPDLVGLARPFEKHILEELRPNPPCQHLYGMKRIAMLLKMMEWPGQPAGQVGHMGLDKFKQRRVLPPASAYGQLTGQAEPVLPVTPPQAGPTNKLELPVALQEQTIAPPRRPRPNQMVTLLTDEHGGNARVQTEDGAEVECSDINPFFRLKTGERIRANVTFQDGEPVSARFRGRA